MTGFEMSLGSSGVVPSGSSGSINGAVCGHLTYEERACLIVALPTNLGCAA